jgi:2-methylcitrate dehydratase PrpD
MDDVAATTGAGLTRAIVQRTMTLQHADLPDEVREIARQCVLDTLGVTIAGVGDPLVRILGEELAEQGGAPAATVVGSRERLPATSAALLNGTMSHALDYDDVNMAMPGHPSVAVLPAVLALAEERGASGAQVIAAFVAGYETQCRLGRVIAPGHYDGLGFHATGTIGTFGAAAGCAHLLGLDEEQTLHALGIAATSAAGLKSMFGTMCKPLHAGRAAYNGLLAARLAARGFTARPDGFECLQGFARTHSPDFKPQAAFETPAGGFFIRNNLFKYHAACYLTHAPIEAVRRLRIAHGLTPERVAGITLRIDQATDRVCNIPSPTSGLECKFSLRQTMAMALTGVDTAGLDNYSAANATNPTLAGLRERVAFDFQQGWPHTRAEVAIRLTDGTTLTAGHDSGIPAPDVAEQGRRLAEKFAGLVTPALGAARTAALAQAIGSLDTLPTVAPLTDLVAG